MSAFGTLDSAAAGMLKFNFLAGDLVLTGEVCKML